MPDHNHDRAIAEDSSGEPLSDEGVVRIVESYSATIERPALSAPRTFLFCPVGLIGSGKSTVTSQIASHFGLARVSGDEIRGLLREKGYSLERVLDIAYATTRKLLDEGCGIAIDSDCADIRVREVLGKLGKEFGYPLVFVHVTAPESILLDRNRQRDAGRKSADDASSIEVLRRRKVLHEPKNLEGVPFVFEFDTSRDDMTAQMEAATSAIEKELLI